MYRKLCQFISFDDSNPTPILHLPHPAHLPLVECGLLCHSSSDETPLCKNQISRTPIFPFLELRPSTISSFGIFATYPIPKGAFISTYAGELITASSAQSRWLTRPPKTKMNYIFCLRLGLKDVYIDAGSIGGIGRFFNHSHSPNIIPLPIFQPPSPGYSRRSQKLEGPNFSPRSRSVVPMGDASTDLTEVMREATMTPRIGFFANRKIDIGEELCWDYGDGTSISSSSLITATVAAAVDRDLKARKGGSEDLDVDGKERTGREQGNGRGRLPCFCQSENCDGYLPFDDSL